MKTLRWLSLKKAQNTAEYAVMIGAIVAAAIAMQVYVRRSVQARVKEAVDFPRKYVNISGTSFFEDNQYEPYYVRTNVETIASSRSSEELQKGGGVVRNVENESATRRGNQIYASYLDNTASIPGGGSSGGTTSGTLPY